MAPQNKYCKRCGINITHERKTKKAEYCIPCVRINEKEREREYYRKAHNVKPENYMV